MEDHEKLECIHSAIQEAQNGNTDGLETALELVEDVREKYKERTTPCYTPERLLWHTGDPCTSIEAARIHKERAFTNMEVVLSKVKEYPYRTAGELAVVCDLEKVETSRRLSDLKRQGVIVNGSSRKCTMRRTKMTTWRVA
jgi:predicted HTH transcriptional regulator